MDRTDLLAWQRRQAIADRIEERLQARGRCGLKMGVGISIPGGQATVTPAQIASQLAAIATVRWMYIKKLGVSGTTNVSQIADQGPNGITLSQATGAFQPGINADGSWSFNGSSQDISGTNTQAQPFSRFMRVRPGGNGVHSNDNILSGGSAGSLNQRQSTTELTIFGGSEVNTGLLMSLNNWHSIGGVFNIAASFGHVDGVNTGSLNPGSSASTSIALGAYRPGSLFWQGDISGAVSYTRALTAAEAIQVASILAQLDNA